MYSYVAEFLALVLLTIVLANEFYPIRPRTASQRYFLASIILTIALILVDGISLITLANTDLLPRWVNYVTNTLYFALCYFVISSYSFYIADFMMSQFENPRAYRTVRAIIWGSCIVCLALLSTNICTGWMFSLDTAERYSQGPIWLLGYIQIALMACLITGLSINYRKEVSSEMLRVVRIDVPVVILLVVFQLCYPHVLLNGMIGAYLAVILMLAFKNTSIETDTLTGLGNRVDFMEEKHIQKGEEVPTHIIVAKVDRFNDINSTYGYAYGNGALKAFAQWVSKQCPRGQAFRVGSTTFLMRLPLPEGTGAADQFEEMVLACPSTVLAHKKRIPIKVNFIDYAVNEERAKPAEILERVEYAKREMSREELRTYRITDETVAELSRKQWITSYLEHAVPDRRIETWVQPIYNTHTRTFTSGEILVRLKDPDGVHISPAEFVPVVEETSLISAIGKQTVEDVCAFFASHPDCPMEYVSLNLAQQQLMDMEFPEFLGKTIAKSSVSNNRLALEVTERMLVSKDNRVNTTIQQLQESGYALLLDDFGSGYSNFATSVTFPFRSVKIDKSLVDSAQDDDFQTMEMLISMFHRKQFSVVVEGIEAKDQARRIIECGADFIQGFYYARPMPLDAALDFLQAK